MTITHLHEYRAMSEPEEPVHWYVARSATRQEHRALRSLTDLGFAAYLPCLTRWQRTGRTKAKIQAPLFPGYLFTALADQDLWRAADADGVHTIMRARGPMASPLAVPQSVVEDIRKQEQRGDFDKTVKNRKRLEAGARVEIVGGQFQGYPAEFVGWREDERIDLLFKMLGRWVPLVLEPDKVGGFAEEDAA